MLHHALAREKGDQLTRELTRLKGRGIRKELRLPFRHQRRHRVRAGRKALGQQRRPDFRLGPADLCEEEVRVEDVPPTCSHHSVRLLVEWLGVRHHTVEIPHHHQPGPAERAEVRERLSLGVREILDHVTGRFR